MAVVLIVDDDPDIRELWALVLGEAGFVVRAAPSGVEGIEIAESEHIDVVVTDILMPNKDGIETLLEIKSINPNVKVLVVSGGGSALRKSFLDVADKLGADATLPKPVDIDRLCAVVEQLAAAAKASPSTPKGT